VQQGVGQVDGPVASFTADGAFDRDDVYGAVAARHPDAAVIVPPRSSAVPSKAAETAPTQRDRHFKAIAEHGRMGWQKASGYNWRALVEADISRWKRVIGDGLRSRTEGRQASEVAIAAGALNRMLELGRPEYVRIACPRRRAGLSASTLPIHATKWTAVLHRPAPDANQPIRATRWPRCYGAGGCAGIIEEAAQAIDVREFNLSLPQPFPRFVQIAIWRFCAQNGLGICNGVQIDDSRRCENTACHLFALCDRQALRPEP
jgi:hypothetical protein